MNPIEHTTSHQRNEIQKKTNTAFTLVELLTVIAIMGILAGMIIGVSGYVWRASKEAKARANLEKIQNALNEYMLENGTYPPAATESDISAIYANISKWLEGTNILVDPWTKPIRYQRTGNMQYILYSWGADMKKYAPGLAEDDIYPGR